MHVALDWKAYFERFREEHGEPLLLRGRLRFGDGWSYSSTDYKGPEWGPDPDPNKRNADIREYWSRRLQITTEEYANVKKSMEHLESLAKSKSLPLLARIVRRDEESGQATASTEPLDLDLYRGRLQWLAEDIEICKEQLDGSKHKVA